MEEDEEEEDKGLLSLRDQRSIQISIMTIEYIWLHELIAYLFLRQPLSLLL